MLTIVACPKPFVAPFDAIQERAIRNWLALDPGIEVLLFGNDDGVAETAARLGARHVAELPRTAAGGPLFNELLLEGSRLAKNDLIAYVNADILLLPNLLSAAVCVSFPRFLLAGYRLDMPASSNSWGGGTNLEHALRNPAAVAELRVTTGCDYLVFRKGTWSALPPLVLGRAGVENGLIHTCVKQRVPVLDATLSVTALHQYHDYSHVPGGRQTAFEGEDAVANYRHCGFLRAHPIDGVFQVAGGQVRKAGMRGDWARRWMVNRPWLNESWAAFAFFRPFHYLLRKAGLSLYREPKAAALVKAQLGEDL